MRRPLIIGLLLPIAAWLLLAPAQALSTAKLRPGAWPHDTTYEFAIQDGTGARIATAYYRILREETEGRPVFRFKYVARNEEMSEAAECWATRDTLLPLRSTRKTICAQGTYYQDVAYKDGVITIRNKREGGQPVENQMPAGTDFFDYEELVWLIPLIDFAGETQARLDVFVTIHQLPATLVVTDLGAQEVTIKNHTYPAQGFSFDINMEQHTLYAVDQSGILMPAQLVIGATTFTNLGLDPKLVKAAAKPAAEPKPAPEAKPAPPAPAPPAAPPADQGQDDGKGKEDEPAPEPGVNPLGPPPPGGRF